MFLNMEALWSCPGCDTCFPTLRQRNLLMRSYFKLQIYHVHGIPFTQILTENTHTSPAA